MSVHKLRTSFDKKGCQVILWVVMVGAAVALAGSGFFACFNPTFDELRNPDADIEMFKVDGKVVSALDVNLKLDVLQPSFTDDSRPDTEFRHLSAAIVSLVTDHVIGSLAREKGVFVDENAALSLRGQEIDSFITQTRFNAVGDGIALTAVESEWQEYFKERFGVGTSEYKDLEVEKTRVALQDEELRASIINKYSRDALVLWYVNETEVTDEEIEASFEQFEMLEMRFNDLDLGLDEREAKASEALAELEAGADFVEVLNKYVENAITVPFTYPRSAIDMFPYLKPVLELKDGEHTGIVYPDIGTPSIYQVVSVTKDLPDDFEDNKELYKSQPRQTKANQAFVDAVFAARETVPIDWLSPSYETVYELALLLDDNELDETVLTERLQEVLDASLTVEDELAGPRAAIFSRYAAMYKLYDISSVTKRKEIASTYAEILVELLELIPDNVQARLDLVEVYERMGDMKAATEMLALAAMSNKRFQDVNQGYYETINRRLIRYQSEEKISEDLYADILGYLVDWNNEKTSIEQDVASQQSGLDKFTIDPLTGELLSDKKDEEAEEGSEEKADVGDGQDTGDIDDEGG